MDIRQTKSYATFMRKIGWQVEQIDDVYIFIKRFPLISATIKIQRINKLPNINKLKQLMHKYHTRSISFEPNITVILNSHHHEVESTLGVFQDPKINGMLNQVQHDKFLNNPYLPTKNILIDLKPKEDDIFKRFSEAKRRAVRRAEKNNVVIKSGSIDEFIKLKSRAAGILGLLTTTTLKPLYEAFAPQNAEVLLAYKPSPYQGEGKGGVGETVSQHQPPPTPSFERRGVFPIAGIFLLFHKKTAYYWMAAATKEGKKSFAPTLLVWEALKLAKQKGCTVFDFEGIYDERYPKLNQNWLGFTKFKSGFGGKEVYYPKPIKIT